jgi:hypothetical protein
MPNLGEVIGALLSDVARARVRADVEAIRIANAYSGDPLLKHLPVPRFRLPEIVIDLPVLLAGVDEPSKAGAPLSVSKPTDVEIRQAAREGIAQSPLRFTQKQVASLSAAPVQRAKQLFETDAPSVRGLGWVADELASAVVGAVWGVTERDFSPEQLEALTTSSKTAMTALVVTKLAPPPSVNVTLTSGAIKEHADNESIVRIRLTISEDAYEVVEREDGQGFHLTPE